MHSPDRLASVPDAEPSCPIDYTDAYSQEISPPPFNRHSALKRLLSGEPPESIFGGPIAQLTPEDIAATYLVQSKDVDQKKKPMVYVLRTAAANTVADLLSLEIIQMPLPQKKDPMDEWAIRAVRQRVLMTFDRMGQVIGKLQTHPEAGSQMERAFEKLRQYIVPSDDTAQSITLRRLRGETLLRGLLPPYINLLMDVYERDHMHFPFLPQIPSFGLFRHIINHSWRDILLTGALGTQGYLYSYHQVASDYAYGSTMYMPDRFTLKTKEKKHMLYVVGLKPEYEPEIQKAYEAILEKPDHQAIQQVGCPAANQLITQVFQSAFPPFLF